MKRTILFTSFLLILSYSYCQQAKIDSLRVAFNTTKEDTTKLSILKKIALESYFIDIESYKTNAEELLALAKKSKSTSGIAFGYNALGRYYNTIGASEKSKEYFLSALKKYRQVGDDKGVASSYNNIASIYIEQNEIDSIRKYLDKAIAINHKHSFSENLYMNYYNLGIVESNLYNTESALSNTFKALHYAEKIKNKRYIANCNSAIGVLYAQQEMYTEAEKYLISATNDFEDMEDSFGMAAQYVNLGILYNERDQNYLKAIKLFQKASFHYFKVGDSVNSSLATGNIGRNYIQLKVLDSAEIYLNRSLLISEKFNNHSEIVSSLTNLGEIEFIKNNPKKAELFLNEAISIAKSRGFQEEYGEALLLLSKINSDEKNYYDAYQNLMAHKLINDSIKSIDTKRMIIDISNKYQNEKKENENLALKQQNAEQALLTEKEKTQKTLMAGGLAVSLAGLVIFFIVYNRNNNQKREIEKQKDLVEELQRELHHRLKNNLSFIDFFITLAKGKFQDPAYAEKLDELQNRINSMFEVHKQLFKKEDVTSVNAKGYISALLENVKKVYDRPNIILEENVEDINLRADTSFPIGLIVNEFVTNSYKYAFPNGENGVISINLKEGPRDYHLQMSDTGKGLPHDFDIDNLDSFGMETIKLLTQEYKGSFKLDGTKGLKMDITFPKKAA